MSEKKPLVLVFSRIHTTGLSIIQLHLILTKCLNDELEKICL